MTTREPPRSGGELRILWDPVLWEPSSARNEDLGFRVGECR